MLTPIPDFGLIPRTSVTVVRSVEVGTDAFNAPVWSEVSEQVDGVVVRPTSTADLADDRPEGTRADVSFAFPKGYGKSLKGCSIVYGGRAYRVIGDPRPLMSEGVPDPWDMTVEAEAVDG